MMITLKKTIATALSIVLCATLSLFASVSLSYAQESDSYTVVLGIVHGSDRYDTAKMMLNTPQ